MNQADEVKQKVDRYVINQQNSYPDFNENSNIRASDGGEAARHDGVKFRLGELVDKRSHNNTRLRLSTSLTTDD